MRTYALADESALLICSWPHGERPKVPFPYFSEVMTGFEYQAAAHMIYEGLVEEGLTVVEAIRKRFDGQRRNPWNEQECGHHYVRAMASWAVLLALAGYHYSAVTKSLQLAPRWQADAFRSLWVMPSGWGMVSQNVESKAQVVQWDVLSGELVVQKMGYVLPVGDALRGKGADLAAATIEVGGQAHIAQVEQKATSVEIAFVEAIKVKTGQSLVVRLELAVELCD